MPPFRETFHLTRNPGVKTPGPSPNVASGKNRGFNPLLQREHQIIDPH